MVFKTMAVNEDTKERLTGLKIHYRETFSDVLDRLLDETEERNERNEEEKNEPELRQKGTETKNETKREN